MDSHKFKYQRVKALPLNLWRFYVDGFKSMGVVGRQLWVLMIVKMVILFAVIKLLFFPDVLKRDYPDDQSRAEAVRTALTTR